MKTLEQFINDNNGKQVEVTGSANAKFQCVDLANAYIRDVLGFPIIEWTNAQDFPKKCLPPNYEYIKNSADNFPLKGDIVIWSSKDKIGHIAICIEDGNTKNFKSFDQNWSKPLYCTLETHVYTGTNHNVIGWLKPKNSIIQDMISDEQKRILDFLNGKTEGDVREAFGALADIPNLNKKIKDLESSQKSLEERIVQLEADASANNKLIESYQSSLTTAKDTESKLQADVQTWKNRYEVALKDQVNKYTGWQLIKLGIKKLQVKK